MSLEVKNKELHNCESYFLEKSYGIAIYYCIEDLKGHFWVGNKEYTNQVNFCPFCGQKAPETAEEIR